MTRAELRLRARDPAAFDRHAQAQAAAKARSDARRRTLAQARKDAKADARNELLTEAGRIRAELLQETDWCCELCGLRGATDLDHILSGGRRLQEQRKDNCIVAHRRCHRARQDGAGWAVKAALRVERLSEVARRRLERQLEKAARLERSGTQP